MKKIIFSFFAIILITGCTPPIEEIDISKEEEAIKALIEKSTQAYWDKDLDILTATQVTDESFIKLQAYANRYDYNVGWEERLKGLTEVYKNNPEPWALKSKNTNYKIKVYPKSAWAVYNETLYDNEENFQSTSIQARFLEKVGKEWKIVYLSSVGVTSYEQEEDDDDVVVVVDDEGDD